MQHNGLLGVFLKVSGLALEFQAEALGKFRELWEVLGKTREYWALLGYQPS